MYCGNNRLDSRLRDGTLVLGTRYKCFQRGVGVGLHQPPYFGPYDPIHREAVYCGTKTTLPQNYDRFGSLSQCFQKGVGVGKKIPRDTSIRSRSRSVGSRSRRSRSRSSSRSSYHTAKTH
jgi:hypothetical protein